MDRLNLSDGETYGEISTQQMKNQKPSLGNEMMTKFQVLHMDQRLDHEAGMIPLGWLSRREDGRREDEGLGECNAERV